MLKSGVYQMKKASDRDWELSKDSVKEESNQLFYKTQRQDKRIAELESALATSFSFLSMSDPLARPFYKNHRHLLR